MPSLYFFNLCTKYIRKNAGLEEIEIGIIIAGKKNNNLKSAEHIPLMAGSEEELRTLLLKVKEENTKSTLLLNIKVKTKTKQSLCQQCQPNENKGVSKVSKN